MTKNIKAFEMNLRFLVNMVERKNKLTKTGAITSKIPFVKVMSTKVNPLAIAKRIIRLFGPKNEIQDWCISRIMVKIKG
jgi:hypothetical protein